MSDKKSFFEKIKSVKNLEIIIAVVLCIVVLVLFFSNFSGSSGLFTSKNNNDNVSPEDLGAWGQMQEAQLEKVISVIEGAGRVSVSITYSSGVEQVYAFETVKEVVGGVLTERTTLITYKGAPLLLKEIAPKIKGVVVVASGADDAVVKLKIVRAVTTLLEVNSGCVEVYKYKK